MKCELGQVCYVIVKAMSEGKGCLCFYCGQVPDELRLLKWDSLLNNNKIFIYGSVIVRDGSAVLLNKIGKNGSFVWRWMMEFTAK